MSCYYFTSDYTLEGLMKEIDTLEKLQLREIELGIQEADIGKFASQEKVDNLLKRWLIFGLSRHS